MTTTHDTHPQYKLRMPPELHAKIKQAAENNHRSMNAEMVSRLVSSFEQRGLSVDSLNAADRVKRQSVIEALAEAQRLLREIEQDRDRGRENEI